MEAVVVETVWQQKRKAFVYIVSVVRKCERKLPLGLSSIFYSVHVPSHKTKPYLGWVFLS